MSTGNRPTRLAVLIDAENIDGGIVILENLFSRIEVLGVASVRRAYGDFTKEHLKGWDTALPGRAIEPVQLFNTPVGKNSSDIALVIDAMDLLHSKRFDGFCIVANDGDYARLASRLRADGMLVFGFGGKQPASSLVAACDEFFKLGSPQDVAATDTTAVNGTTARPKDIPLKALLDAVKHAADAQGWAPLSAVGNLLKEQVGDFDCTDYGHKKLRGLLVATGRFKLKGGEEGIPVQARAIAAS